ncbi:hypothetical protein ACJ41O_003659 [Fusarium nematophilum]
MASHNISAGTHVPFSNKTRGATACEKCRLRKTKCDNRRPSCGYCLKRHIHCVYPDDNETGSVTGADILQAINKLTRLVESQHQHQYDHPQAHSTPAQVVSPSLSWPHSTSQHQEALHYEPDNPPRHAATRAQGVESILEWRIFASERPIPCLFAQRNPLDERNYPLPDTSYSQLARLESKYIDHVHFKNPILDLGELHQMMLHVAENGLDWSTRTCLVTIVCAIAAITDAYPNPATPLPGQKPEDGTEMELSLQFWNLSMKRLGYAASQNTVQAVQCLCLAGIWYMHLMEPLEAWKHFNLAGAAWHSLTLVEFPFGELINHSGGPSNEFTVMQALYFTIWKSECELRLELPLPSPPVLDNTYFPLEFPQPPSLDPQPASPDVAERERSWYYYLSEITARHLINRVLQMNSEIPELPMERHVCRMIKQAEMIQAQIFDWHSSLPPMFKFGIPEGYDAEFHPDAMVFVLRHRYITLRELVSRPFVRLCVDHLVNEMNPSLQAQVAELASQNLQFCMLKLCQTVAYRQQGTWYMLRTITCSSLILAAVCMAHRRVQGGQAPHSAAMQSLTLPEGWRHRISRAVDSAQPFFDESRGGGSKLKSTIQTVLESLDATPF